MPEYTDIGGTEYWPGEWVSRSEIEPSGFNPNEMDDDDFQQLVHSITDNGWTMPIVVHADENYIIDGEHRWRAAKELPDDPDLTPPDVPPTHVPVYGITVTEEHAKLATVQHNRSTGSLHAARLRDYLEDLESRDVLDDVYDRIGVQEQHAKEILGDLSVKTMDGELPWESDSDPGEAPIPELHEDRTYALRAGEDESPSEETLTNAEMIRCMLGLHEYERVCEALGADMRAQSLVNLCRYIDDHDIELSEITGG